MTLWTSIPKENCSNTCITLMPSK
ncbi:hypothetical protein EON65_02170 [archaeon]|nr:MAG: hypothetical protein EON65_02170 [archaeon]